MATITSQFVKEVGLHIRAGYSYLYVVTDDVKRLCEELALLCQEYLNKEIKIQGEFAVFKWSCTERWQRCGPDGAMTAVPNIVEDGEGAGMMSDFSKVTKLSKYSICVMEGMRFGLTLQNPKLLQMVKDMNPHLQKNNKIVIFADPIQEMPIDIKPIVTVLDHPLPTGQDIETCVDSMVKYINQSDTKIKMSADERYRVVEALKGMSLPAIDNALAYSSVKAKKFDPAILLEEKCKAIKKVVGLEYITSDASFDKIGGLHRVKRWILRRSITLTDKAKKYGIKMSKGILLLGVPGTGKSDIAKAVANMFKLPLIGFHMSQMFGSLVGESEARIQIALKTISAMAPCVLIIDEVDKAAAGSGSSFDGDSGVGKRVFGEFLKWQQDRAEPIFAVFTANNIEGIPVEFFRPGRVDAIFFVDIPQPGERRDIFRSQFNRQGLDPSKFNLDALVEAAPNYTGAEIQRAIEESKILAATHDRTPTTDDVVACIEEIKPEYKKNTEKINLIRTRAAQLATPASDEEKPPPAVTTTKDGSWVPEGRSKPLLDEKKPAGA